MKNKKTFLSMFWRSFFIQAIWNFERLQNVGFAFGMYPFLLRLYPDPAQRKAALLRHLGFFNTHPYMVNIIFGMVASLEEEMKQGKPVREDELNLLKNNMAGPLAAIGDTFFWATWRPFTILLGITMVLLFYKFNHSYGAWLAPVTFLVLYNGIHVPFRFWSLKISYQMRTKIVEIIADLDFQYAVDIVRIVGVVTLLLVLIFYFWAFTAHFYERIMFLGVFAAAIAAGCLRLSSVTVFYGVIAASIGLAFARGY